MSGLELATESPTLAAHGLGVQLMLELEAGGAITATSLVLDDVTMDYDRYEALARLFGEFKKRSSWWIGDLLISGETSLGESYAQMAGATGLSEQTLVLYVAVCAAVPRELRRPELSFGCHTAVRRLSHKEQKHWLDRAVKGGWSEAELRERMKAKRRETHPPLIDPDGEQLKEVALAILRDAVEHIDGQHWLVPNEDMARLRAATGMEDE